MNEQQQKPEMRRGACPQCGGDLKRAYSKRKERYYWFCQSAEEVCSAVYSDDDGEPKLTRTTREPVPGLDCPECGAGMLYVEGKFGAFLSCSDRDCNMTIDLADPAQPPGPDNLPPLCPDDPEHGFMRRRRGKKGDFWGCREYPGCTATEEVG